MATGDYSQKIETSSRDEVGQLATAFNKMSSELAGTERLRGAFPDLDWASLRLAPEQDVAPLLAPGDRIEPPGLLFQKLAPEQLQEWADRFGGQEEGS